MAIPQEQSGREFGFLRLLGAFGARSRQLNSTSSPAYLSAMKTILAVLDALLQTSCSDRLARVCVFCPCLIADILASAASACIVGPVAGEER